MIDVVIVDDSALMRSLLSEIINAEPDMRVAGTASDALKARELLRRTRADVLTLDIEMPKMNGLEFLEKLMAVRPMPVVMISTHTAGGSDLTMRALEIGAVDFVAKPSLGIRDGISELEKQIVEKVRVAAKARVRTKAVHRSTRTLPASAWALPADNRSTIAIGASTGGTQALGRLFSMLPPDLPPIVVAQHMPPLFTTSFAARLNETSRVTVKEAQDGEIMRPGHAYIAPGGSHLRVRKRGGSLVTSIGNDPAINHHRPSVDALFSSVQTAVGSGAIGVLLTGMGSDGAAGMLELHRAGAVTIAQSEESSLIFGMPKSAIDLGAVDAVLDIDEMMNAITGVLVR